MGEEDAITGIEAPGVGVDYGAAGGADPAVAAIWWRGRGGRRVRVRCCGRLFDIVAGCGAGGVLGWRTGDVEVFVDVGVFVVLPVSGCGHRCGLRFVL